MLVRGRGERPDSVDSGERSEERKPLKAVVGWEEDWREIWSFGRQRVEK